MAEAPFRVHPRDRTAPVPAPPVTVDPEPGACHGFRVRGETSFALTRPCDGISLPELEVRQAPAPPPEPAAPPLRTWLPDRRNPFSARLHRVKNGYGFWMDWIGRFLVDPARPRITVWSAGPRTLWEPRLWGLPAALCYMGRGDVSLHAAAVEVEGSALLLVGPSRMGKSTLAGAFLRAGHRILAEDSCRCTPPPAPAVHPGPALLRLRRDVREFLGPLPGTRVVFEERDRIHLALDGAGRGDGAPVPLGAVVLLWGPAETVRLEPVPAAEAVGLLWSMSFNLSDEGDRARCFRGVAALAGAVPIWRLARPMDDTGPDPAVEEVVKTCLR